MKYTVEDCQDLKDLDLILQYQAKGDNVFFNELYRRYTPLIKSQSYYIYRRCRPSLSNEESMSDAMLAFSRAVMGVDIRRVTHPESFSIMPRMMKEVQRLLTGYFKPLRAKKRGYIEHEGKKIYMARQEIPLVESISFSMPSAKSTLDKIIEREVVQEFYSSLTVRELAVFRVLISMPVPVMTKATRIAGFSERGGIGQSMKKKFENILKA